MILIDQLLFELAKRLLCVVLNYLLRKLYRAWRRRNRR
jgi:hypothetical protein